MKNLRTTLKTKQWGKILKRKEQEGSHETDGWKVPNSFTSFFVKSIPAVLSKYIEISTMKTKTEQVGRPFVVSFPKGDGT